MTATDRAADASLREWARDRLIDEREQLREQNKALLEALAVVEESMDDLNAASGTEDRPCRFCIASQYDGKDGIIHIQNQQGIADCAIVVARIAIAQAEQRGGSRADGPLLRGPIACSACSGKVVIADWGTCALCGLKQQAYPSSEEKANA